MSIRPSSSGVRSRAAARFALERQGGARQRAREGHYRIHGAIRLAATGHRPGAAGRRSRGVLDAARSADRASAARPAARRGVRRRPAVGQLHVLRIGRCPQPAAARDRGRTEAAQGRGDACNGRRGCSGRQYRLHDATGRRGRHPVRAHRAIARPGNGRAGARRELLQRGGRAVQKRVDRPLDFGVEIVGHHRAAAQAVRPATS